MVILSALHIFMFSLNPSTLLCPNDPRVIFVSIIVTPTIVLNLRTQAATYLAPKMMVVLREGL